LLDSKKISDWSTTNSTKSKYTQDNSSQPDVLPSGPIDLTLLLKYKNDTYLKQLVNPKCFPIMMVTPGFDDSALVEQEEDAPFNIIALPIFVNEIEANDVRIVFINLKYL